MKEINIEVKEKSMSQKREDREITEKEYKNYLANKNGFKNFSEYDKYLIEKRGFKNGREYRLFLQQKHGFKTRREYLNNIATKNGFKTHKEYCDYLAVKNGFINHKDYINKQNHKTGRTHSQSENKKCALYLGVCIAEGFLSKIFENVTRMPQNFSGYDFMCNKGYKIDVKSSCILRKKNGWLFNIRKNKIADYFLLLAFDNRKDLNPLHIWLINRESFVNSREEMVKISDKQNLIIYNSTKSIKYYEKYEKEDKLKLLIDHCKK